MLQRFSNLCVKWEVWGILYRKIVSMYEYVSDETNVSSIWDCKHRKARLKLSEYLALVATHELWEHVFGFLNMDIR